MYLKNSHIFQLQNKHNASRFHSEICMQNYDFFLVWQNLFLQSANKWQFYKNLNMVSFPEGKKMQDFSFSEGKKLRNVSFSEGNVGKKLVELRENLQHSSPSNFMSYITLAWFTRMVCCSMMFPVCLSIVSRTTVPLR